MRFGLMLACLAAACTYPEKHFAGPYDCLGAPPPTTAKPLVSLQGSAVDPSNLMPLAGVMITLQDRNMATISGPLTTDGTGGFQFSLNTNGTPVEGVYLSTMANGRARIYFAPGRPIVDDLVIPLAVLSTTQGQNLALGALGMPFTAGTGAALLTLQDCNDKAIAGATVSSMPAGIVRYFDGIMPSMVATATDAGGVALVGNLPPGRVTFTVTLGDITFPGRSFNVVADSFLETHITP